MTKTIIVIIIVDNFNVTKFPLSDLTDPNIRMAKLICQRRRQQLQQQQQQQQQQKKKKKNISITVVVCFISSNHTERQKLEICIRLSYNLHTYLQFYSILLLRNIENSFWAYFFQWLGYTVWCPVVVKFCIHFVRMVCLYEWVCVASTYYV